jgi:uncharacterized protein
MICKDDQLAALDVETARLFTLARDGAQTTEDRKKELLAMQRGFIKGRDDCWKADDKRACIADKLRHPHIRASQGLCGCKE